MFNYIHENYNVGIIKIKMLRMCSRPAIKCSGCNKKKCACRVQSSWTKKEYEIFQNVYFISVVIHTVHYRSSNFINFDEWKIRKFFAS